MLDAPRIGYTELYPVADRWARGSQLTSQRLTGQLGPPGPPVSASGYTFVYTVLGAPSNLALIFELKIISE